MKHVVKILSLLVAVSGFWIALLQAAIIPPSHTWLAKNFLSANGVDMRLD
ncbi:hypothetical protein CARUB_v10015056mg [Capsella rubella]|uniref:Uncharacterized protein n=1 Tax=Capsella rubella TaxID=81985 RepID=R0G871_9BRAS|nr:hypothetical protein CARUB_v10015056mg [Capsella rubella]